MADPKLTKLELLIMDALWTQRQASIRDIQEAFPEKNRPAYTTIQTTVYRLEAKKAVRRVKKVGNFHIFEAAISRTAAQRKLIDDLLARGSGDWIDDVADALPMTVIGDIIGIPEQDRPRIFDGFDHILKVQSKGAQMDTDVFGSIFAYAMELTAEKRRNPADDIWSTIASGVITGDDGEQFSLAANELEFFFFVLAFAGSDTTKNALAIGLQAFVANREQIERYRDDESVRSSAVEEVLRWSSPVAYWTRSTKVDIEMDGQHIPKGERVVSMLRSANRDEEVFDSPFTFDIGRQPNPHVAFGGGGAHHCLGAMLARAEIRAVLDELLLRGDEFTLGPARVTYPNLTTNMSIYDEMPITLRAR